jgi:hypothetical protein
MYGSMRLAAGLTGACDYDYGMAWRFWDKANEIARPLGEDYWHPWNGFGRADLEVYAVTIDVALGRHSEASRRAEAIDVATIQSATERSRYLIDVARGHLGRRDDVAATHLMLRAHQESPEQVKHGEFGRSVTRELFERGHSAVRAEVRALVEQVELLV